MVYHRPQNLPMAQSRYRPNRYNTTHTDRLWNMKRSIKNNTALFQLCKLSRSSLVRESEMLYGIEKLPGLSLFHSFVIVIFMIRP